VPPSEKTGTDYASTRWCCVHCIENPSKRYQQATQLRDEVTKTQASGVRGADAVPRPAKPVPPQNSVMRTLYTVWRMAKDGSGWKAAFGAFALMALTAIIGVSVALWGPHQWFTKPKSETNEVIPVKSSISQASTVPKAVRDSKSSAPAPKPEPAPIATVAPQKQPVAPPSPMPAPVVVTPPPPAAPPRVSRRCRRRHREQ